MLTIKISSHCFGWFFNTNKSSNVGATSHSAPLFNLIPFLVTTTGTKFVVCAVCGLYLLDHAFVLHYHGQLR